MYKIVRNFLRGGKRTIESGLTLEEAQAHCKSPESSWKTATSYRARKRTQDRGPWFDGYTENGDMQDIEYNNEPLFTHDCECCKFLGSYQLVDLYFHPGNGVLKTVIARYSCDGSDYVSGIHSALSMEKDLDHKNHPLLEALRRARKLGYIQEIEE